MILPPWLQWLVRVAGVLLTAQALIVASFTRAGVPQLWASAAIGIIGVLALTVETVVDALTSAGAQTPLVRRLVAVFNALLVAQGTFVNLLAPINPPARVISILFGAISAVTFVLQLLANVKATSAAKAATVGAGTVTVVVPPNW